MKKILIAIDKETNADSVAEHGFELARLLNAEAGLLSVVDTRHLKTANSDGIKEMVEIAKNELRNFHLIITTKYSPNHPIETVIKEGNPYQLILESADLWNADLIVIGTHGRKGITHLLIGSVAEKVIRHSNKQVLVIPAKLSKENQ